MMLRRELMIVLGVFLMGWIVLMAVVGRWQRGRAGERVTAEPQLIHYPGTESAPEQTSPSLGFRKYWFHLNQDYPSLSAFSFYEQKLEPGGWRLLGQGQPQWFRRVDKDAARDLFRATWIPPNGLFQLDLEMMSTVKLTQHEGGTETEERQPGMDVFVTLRRALFPGVVTPVPESESGATPPRPQIQVK